MGDDPDRLPTLTRRSALAAIGVLGAGLVVACTSRQTASTSTTTTGTTTTGSATTTAAAGAACDAIPEETAGPYPGDGSNGPDVLTQDGVVRSDIRSSFGSATGTAEGVPLTLELTVQDLAAGCEALTGAAVYAWHCDREGRYSMYSQGAQNANYLRGVQETDRDGVVTFTSIFPAAYDGRWPHVHFEVYADVDAATSGGTPLATSQLAFPEAVCDAVYATSGYEASVRNMTRTSLTDDMVFRDGVEHQMATVEGDPTDGYVATLTFAVPSASVSRT